MTAHHAHSHSHALTPANMTRAFVIATALNIVFVIAELGFGIFANSLALIADAGHNFMDVIGLVLAGGAAWLASHKPTPTHTYGYRRASILAALVNAALLLVAVGAIVWEAVRRLWEPAPVAVDIVVAVAAVGVVINSTTALLFLRGQEDINVRGAFLHMAADAAVSLGVVVAALLIAWSGWLWIDPAVSILVAVVIVVSGWGFARDALRLALDAVPVGIDRHAVEAYLAGLPGVASVHDLHIWAMSTTETALTAHLVRPEAGLDDALLHRACHQLEYDFGIHHVTLQFERGDVHTCRQADDATV